MKESYTQGLAIHCDPESCVVDGNVGGEALTGDVQAGHGAAKLLNYSGVPTP